MCELNHNYTNNDMKQISRDSQDLLLIVCFHRPATGICCNKAPARSLIHRTPG